LGQTVKSRPLAARQLRHKPLSLIGPRPVASDTPGGEAGFI
jgi:hypothetical protein